MVKLSISLPNSTQITLESEESEFIQGVLGMVLNGFPLAAAPGNTPAPAAPPAVPNGQNGEHNADGEKSTDVTPAPPAAPPPSNGAVANRQPYGGEPAQAAPPAPAPPAPAPAVSAAAGFAAPMLPANEADDDGLYLESQTPESRSDYIAFCQAINPMGDMRRVVVAAEAASRFFQAEGVNADELGELFDLAGWRRANSFTQTLRNAARSKFGWLERIPGRSGRYAATDLGRSVTLGG